jgi:hypothetical protein
MADESHDAQQRGAEPAPGDIGRGTQETTTASPAEPGASRSQDFAARQSFADPAHREGSPAKAPEAVPSKEIPPGHGEDGLRTQETGSEEGARTPARQAVTTTSRESLDATTKEGQE